MIDEPPGEQWNEVRQPTIAVYPPDRVHIAWQDDTDYTVSAWDIMYCSCLMQ